MKVTSLHNPKRAIGIAAALLALAAAVPAQAYKYQFTTVAEGVSGNFLSTEDLFDNGAPSTLGPYTFRTTAWFDDPKYSQPADDGETLNFYPGVVKFELVQNGVTYASTRSAGFLTIGYNPFVNDYGSLTFSVQTEYQDGKWASVSSYMQVQGVASSYANVLTPGFTVSANYSSYDSMTRLWGNTEDWFGSTGSFYEAPRKITWNMALAVPEPASYAMMLLGGAVMAGAGALRRRREAVAR